MYHSVGYADNNGLIMNPEEFRKQIQYIKENNYTVLTLNELYEIFNKNLPIPEKSVVITFDDGYADNYKYAYPILKEFGIKATIFVITDTIDEDNNYLNSQQIKELQNNGIDIQDHTCQHIELDKLTYEKQLETINKSKEYLEKLLNKKVNYISYPYGKYNEDTIKAVKDAGYLMGFTTKEKTAKKSNGIYAINRIYINSLDEFSVFIGKLKNTT
ncbi:polysaccharide deacetylase family protein [Tissierella sp. MB52-C2]|uniref:polysaccharide deacetylase family protein n=1 Tax=Tissierella sp. MB52-C2 TaxID=3070999 RepID=UPI00280B3330|nr:polysaccharide deacetylase family protein [Tissierella sp. MB52-C2]WMM26342.1 polysaccharide deacetylase family protein [Tissierella sp. MB52-C2]